MNIYEITDYYKTLDSRLKSRVSSVLYSYMLDIKGELEKRSPIDSGDFKSNWRLSHNRSSGVIAGYTLSNPTPYSTYLDLGAEKGVAPWYFPNKPSNPGPVSNSGKLIVKNGRVWAGGLSPSGHVIGGIINPIIYHNNRLQLQIVNSIADCIVGTL